MLRNLVLATPRRAKSVNNGSCRSLTTKRTTMARSTRIMHPVISTLSSMHPSSNVKRSFTSTRAVTFAQIKEFENLCELQAKSCEKFSDRPCFGSRSEKGDKYDWISYKDFGRRVEKFRNVLTHHKIGKGDKVALISNNRVGWAVAFYATAGVGASIVPMYEAQMEKDWRYIITDSDTKLILAANEAIYQKVATYAGTVGKVESVICLDAASSDMLYCYHRWMDLVDKEAPVPVAPIIPQDICTIIYTSGTTGNPKVTLPPLRPHHRPVNPTIHTLSTQPHTPYQHNHTPY